MPLQRVTFITMHTFDGRIYIVEAETNRQDAKKTGIIVNALTATKTGVKL